jgi:hypothetical protein
MTCLNNAVKLFRNKLKINKKRLINGNQEDKFKRKYIVMVTFYEKGCCKGDIVFSLSITNPLPKSLKLMHILGSIIFLKIL